MKTRYYHRILELVLGVGCWVLAAACSSDSASDNEEPLPEGMGRIRITICTPEANSDLTRAVNATPWENPDHEWEWLHSYRILICNSSNVVVQVIDGNTMSDVSSSSYPYKQSAILTSDALTAGSYNIYALANFASYSDYEVGTTINPDATIKFANGYSETNIPMTGKLASSVTVNSGETKDVGIITVWRVISKLQFYFTNEATEQIKIYGIEVEPINTNASKQGLVYLFSKDDLTSTANLPASGGVTLPSGVTNGKVKHPLTTPDSPLLTLNAYSGTGDKPTGTLFFYVNETNGTFTTTQNEISLRFKIKRGDATEEELRYGLTTHYGDGSTGQDGFNVIRRNDWIHIPIIVTDWQLRIEPLAFVPIAGYPATTLSSDGLTATFSTGGMIALQPFIKKKGDVPATWLDFGDTRIKDVIISWTNADGDTQSGSGRIITTPFAYDSTSKCIIGELNNSLNADNYSVDGLKVYTEGGHKNFKTTFTIKMKLKGPEDPEDSGNYIWYNYSFTFNVILQK